VIFRPSHFTAVLIFATCVSVVFGITMRATPVNMVRFGAWCFSLFVAAAIVLSWAMYFIAR